MRLILQVSDVVNQLRLSVCPLFVENSGRGSGLSPHQVGTAVLFRDERAYYVLTAGHVLSGTEGADLMIPVLNDVPSAPQFQRLSGLSIRSEERKKSEMDYDIAAFSVTSSDAAALDSRGRIFNGPEDIGNADDEIDQCDSLYVLYGFPQSANQSVREGEGLDFAAYYLQFSQRANANLISRSGKSSSTHFGLLGRKRIQTIDGKPGPFPPKFNGMSGGGIWKLHVDRKGWVIRCRLVGIFIEQTDDRGHKLFQATRIEYALVAQLLLQHEAPSLAVLDKLRGTRLFTSISLPSGQR
jgi:hypothetical protein